MAEQKQLAIVTGASTGIGFELAHIAAERGHDVVIAADEPLVNDAAEDVRRHGTEVVAVEADLATFEGNDRLLAAVGDRPVALLLANAGRGLGQPFLTQDAAEWRRVIDTNIVGTTYLLQRVGSRMKEAGAGRILITGSIAGLMPGSFQAVYNGTKAYLDSFSYALREEMRGTGVTVTVLMPGATETEFFDRAHMEDTKIGSARKDDAGKVARDGWEAMMAGSGHVVSGWQNKLQAAMSHLLPDTVLAKLHRGMAEPGSAD